MSAADYCPSCDDEVVADSHRRCSWCGSMTRRRTGSRPRKLVAIDEATLERARDLYYLGHSMREVAEQILERTSYANPEAAIASLYSAFRVRGWQRRTTDNGRLAHGRSRRELRGTPEHNAHRRALARRRAAAERQPCQGDECSRLARDGREYCQFCCPELRQLRDEILADARRAARGGQIRWGDHSAPILEWASTQRYPVMRLAERAGVPEATVRRALKKAPDDTITRELLERLLGGITNPAAEAATTQRATA